MKPARMMTTLLMLLVAHAARAQEANLFAPLVPYVDSQTLLLADVDLERLNPDAADEKLLVLLQSIHRREFEPDKAAADLKANLAAARTWRERFLKSGGRHIYALWSLVDLPHDPPSLIIPHAKGADVEPLRSLFLGGRGDGRQNGGDRWLQVAQPLTDSALFVGTELQFKRLRTMKPEPRPDLDQAVATLAADAAVRILFIPSGETRRAAESLLPPFPRAFGPDAARTVSRGIVFASLSTDLSAKSPTTITIQSEDAAAANAFAEFVRTTFAHFSERLPGRPPAFDLQFKVNGDRLVATLDSARGQVLLAQTVIPALKAARLRAERVKSSSQMRQILQAMLIYMNERKLAWPEKLEDLVEANHLEAPVLQPPYTGFKARYVYVKPTLPYEKVTGETILIYEDPPQDGLLTAGFFDSHSELITTQQFEKFMKAQKEQQQPK